MNMCDILAKISFLQEYHDMPANKNQIRRFQTILKMLRQNRYPNYTSFVKEMKLQEFTGEYSISAKTFQRDICELRDEYGAPIHYDSSRKGFYLSNTDWYNEDLMVEPFEMKAALLSERIASRIFPEPMRSEMNKAVSALMMKNENGMDEKAELDCFQVLCPEYLPQVDPDIFLNCYNAWEQRKTLSLKYRSAKKNQSEKIFEPHIFAWNGGCWYLKGKLLCNDGEHYEEPKVQILALHRVLEATILKNTRFYPAPEILKSVKEEGLFNFSVYKDIEIEFFAPFDVVMYERYANAPGAVKERKEDSVVIHLDNLPEYDAVQLALSACGNAKVHAPVELKQALRKIAEKIISNSDE